MGLQEIESIIANLGFPVVISIALILNNRETIKRYEALLKEYRATIDQNTAAIHEMAVAIKQGKNNGL